jgi:uncharacterized protein (TIGR03086 family)
MILVLRPRAPELAGISVHTKKSMSRLFKTSRSRRPYGAAMSELPLMTRAAAPTIDVVRHVEPDQLSAPTPCAGWDVRQLANHMLSWAPALEGAARKEQNPVPAESEENADLVDGWADALVARLGRVAVAWREPSAWEGVTYLGSPMELPASLVGGMVVGELVVHGWDLGRATGQHPEWDHDLLDYLYEETAKNAEQGRQLGVYGPEVPVSDSAPMLDRVLGLTGRDAGWSG